MTRQRGVPWIRECADVLPTDPAVTGERAPVLPMSDPGHRDGRIAGDPPAAHHDRRRCRHAQTDDSTLRAAAGNRHSAQTGTCGAGADRRDHLHARAARARCRPGDSRAVSAPGHSPGRATGLVLHARDTRRCPPRVAIRRTAGVCERAAVPRCSHDDRATGACSSPSARRRVARPYSAARRRRASARLPSQRQREPAAARAARQALVHPRTDWACAPLEHPRSRQR